ncbi:MAG: hypothetical protein WDM80_06030 [Limisphaerales bacterium]
MSNKYYLSESDSKIHRAFQAERITGEGMAPEIAAVYADGFEFPKPVHDILFHAPVGLIKQRPLFMH